MKQFIKIEIEIENLIKIDLIIFYKVLLKNNKN
jgi:hypothetical protein